jgi:hypothetical protein
MATTATVLGPVVDVLVARSVGDLCVAELQAVLTGVVPQVQRLEGFVSVVWGELQARTGGVLRTEDGGSRSVASWLAEQQRVTPSAVGGELRTSTRSGSASRRRATHPGAGAG